MLFFELFTAFLIALLLSAIICGGYGWQRPGCTDFWSSFLFVFFILWLFSWSGGVWMTPFGPAVRGFYGGPFLYFGVLIALLIIALSPPPEPREIKVVKTDEREDVPTQAAVATLSLFFWLMMLTLILSLVLHYAK